MTTIFMRFPGWRAKALTFSYDDGVEQDIRLVEILNKYGLKGTFNINSGAFSPEGTVHPKGRIHRRMTKKQVLELFSSSQHEVAVHALTHPYLEQTPVNMAVNEVIEDRKNIEEMFGTIARGMAYPYGTTSDEVVDILRACGIAYSRTTKSSHNFDIPTDWLRLPPTCHHNDPQLDELCDKFLNKPAMRAPWLFYVWGHSFEFESADNWDLIENFAAKVAFHDDIWYATNIEVYDYVMAYRSMLFSTDGKRAFNPTCYELFFTKEEKDYSVKPGETIIVD